MIGNLGSNWLPSGWSIYTGPGKYSSDGVMGPLDYFKDFSLTNVIIKFDYNIHSTDSTVLFSCRASSTFSDVIQPSLNPDGFTHIDECNNGNCYRDLPASNLHDVPYDQSLGTHHIELSCLNSNITLKEDDNIVLATTSNVPLSTGIRFYVSAGSNTVSNLKICDPTGCTLPDTHLNVPLIKQYDFPAGAQVYDSANKWAPNNPYITAWGCALTSATMVLKYFGITQLPDNTPLDPGTLNAWLKTQPDGYVGNGLFNWLAIPRLTKLIQFAGNNPNFKFDAVQYQRIQGHDTTTLTSDLQNNQPDILEEPNHFVVATGTDNADNTFTINDPYFSRNTLNDSYNNTFSSIGRYIGSHTDLSYIMLAGDQSINFSLKDNNGNPVGFQFTQDPLADDTNPTTLNGPPVHIFYAQTPAGNGNYTVTATSSNNQPFSITSFLYDVNGNVKPVTLTGTVGTNNPNTFTLSFNSSSSSSDTIQRVVTFSTLLDDINQLHTSHLLKDGAYFAYLALAKNAKNQVDHHNILTAKIQLTAFQKILNAEKGSLVDPSAFVILQGDLQYLLGHI